MDTLLNSATFKLQHDYPRVFTATVKISLYKRDKSFKLRYLYKARESDYYINFSGPYSGFGQDSIDFDVNSKPEKQFEEVCFHWYRMQINSEHDLVTKAWGIEWGINIFSNGLRVITPYVYNTATNRFTLYLKFERNLDYFAKEFSRISGMNISETEISSMMLTVTNDSVSLNRIIGSNGVHPQLQVIKELDNPTDFILMTLRADRAFEAHRTPSPSFSY